MSVFLGIVRYEYRMAVRRWGMWVASAIAALPSILSACTDQVRASNAPIWAVAGTLALSLNMLMPIIGGVSMADRLPRDDRLGTRELLASAPLRRHVYVLGKYVGVVAATVTPVLAAIVLLAAIISVRSLGVAAGARLPAALHRQLVLRQLGVAPTELLSMIGSLLVAFLAINLPAYLFVGAFSLACPAVLPVRVYQVLYTGYWFWGNFLNPEFIPTVADTPLAPCGKFVAGAFFGVGMAGTVVTEPLYTAGEAVLNISVLLACAAAALIALERYLAWREVRA